MAIGIPVWSRRYGRLDAQIVESAIEFRGEISGVHGIDWSLPCTRNQTDRDPNPQRRGDDDNI